MLICATIPTQEVFPMKQKFIPLDKLSKRKRKEYHEAKRRNWGGFNPVTRKTANIKVYNRKKSGQRDEHGTADRIFLWAGFFVECGEKSKKQLNRIKTCNNKTPPTAAFLLVIAKKSLLCRKQAQRGLNDLC